jgi:hypothetical protein
LIAVIASVALAHPFDADFFGHRVDLHVAADRLQLQYTADLPMRKLLSEVREVERKGGDGEAYVNQQDDELLAGLVVTVDGADIAMTRIPVDQPPSTPRTMIVVLALDAPLDPGVPHHVEVGNANRPEETTYFCDAVTVDRSWLVTAVSATASGEWRMQEDYRKLTVDVAPRTGLARVGWWLGPDRHGSRTAADALRDGGIGELGRGYTPFAGGIAAVLAALGWRWRRRAGS